MTGKPGVKSLIATLATFLKENSHCISDFRKYEGICGIHKIAAFFLPSPNHLQHLHPDDQQFVRESIVKYCVDSNNVPNRVQPISFSQATNSTSNRKSQEISHQFTPDTNLAATNSTAIPNITQEESSPTQATPRQSGRKRKNREHSTDESTSKPQKSGKRSKSPDNKISKANRSKNKVALKSRSTKSTTQNSSQVADITLQQIHDILLSPQPKTSNISQNSSEKKSVSTANLELFHYLTGQGCEKTR